MRSLPVGTRSILIGAHQFLIHPLYVAKAWRLLYGPPRDPRLWLAFFLHDLGYWGRHDLDGPDGERHVEWAARVMRPFGRDWSWLCLLHSRYYARSVNLPPSRLCAADKLAMTLEPEWLYLPRVILSGECWEYLHEFAFGKYGGHGSVDITRQELQARRLTPRVWRALRTWYRHTRAYLREWAYEHADGRADTWTPTLELQAEFRQGGTEAGRVRVQPGRSTFPQSTLPACHDLNRSR